MRGSLLVILIIIGGLVGAGWILLEHPKRIESHAPILIHGDEEKMREISEAYVHHADREDVITQNKPDVTYGDMDKEALEEKVHDEDYLLEKTLGEPAVQAQLKSTLMQLQVDGRSWSSGNDAWRLHVDDALAQALTISLSDWQIWWRAIESSQSVEELALTYPNFQDKIWDVYIHRNDIRLIYANEFLP